MTNSLSLPLSERAKTTCPLLPYDDAFLPDNDAYYNSKLLQVAFGDLFPSAPMRWRDKENRVPQYWQEHFEKLGMSVPEGVMGTTTSLSQSKLLRIINNY